MSGLIRYHGGKSLLSQMNDEFNRLFYPENWSSCKDLNDSSVCSWVPSIDIKEKEDRYEIHADLPGVKPEGIDIAMENGLLSIKGSNHRETEDKKENYLRIERSTGSFLRQVAIPEAVDIDSITAKMKHGVLEIVLPKSKETSSKKIKVELN